MDAQHSSNTQFLDVLIIGGGPSGIAAGMSLLKRGDVDVMIVERGDYSEYKYGVSLSSDVRPNLEYLDVWQDFTQTQNLQAFHSQVSWGSESQRQLEYMFTPHGSGWNLDRIAFDKLLANAFVNRGGKLLCDSQIITCERQTYRGWRVQLKSKDQQMQTIVCKYIIDASGRRGVMRTNLNLALTVYDRLIGVSCIGQLPADAIQQVDNQVEACKYGWWHLAPLSDNKVSVVLMTDPDIAHKMQACHPDVWHGLLKELPFMGKAVEGVTFADKPRSFPCFSSYLKEAGGKDWVAVGDAVASYDPISSSGIRRALENGIHGAFMAVDGLFSSGDLLTTYSQAIEQEFKQYLQTQWQYYQRETRWPDTVFWARRRAVVALSKDAVVHATQYFEHKLARAPIHLKANELQDLWLYCELGRPIREVVALFSQRHLHLPESKILLGLQELIETGYLEVQTDEEEDCVFLNTDRLHFD